MSRKSKAQRIAEGNQLITSIKADLILAQEQQWLLCFLTDLVSKFARGKGGTSRQRSLFDQKISAGIPDRKVNNHAAQPEVLDCQNIIHVLQSHMGLYEWEIRVGSELIATGLQYNLSEAQLKLLNGITKRAKDFKAQLEQLMPSEERIKEAELLVKLAKCYKRLNARKWKDVTVVCDAIEKKIPFTDKQFDALLKAVVGMKKKYDKFNSKAVAGSLVKALVYNGSVWATSPGIIIGQVEFKEKQMYTDWQGQVLQSYMYIPVLVGEQVYEVSPGNILKYTKKELKEMGV